MLQELLDTRVMVKNSMKLHNKLANQDPGEQKHANYFCLQMIKKQQYIKEEEKNLVPGT